MRKPRYLAVLPAIALALSTSIAPVSAQETGGVTALALDGWNDDGPFQTVLQPPAAAFSVHGDPGRLVVEVTPPADSDAGPWILEFRAPTGKSLAPGKYSHSNGGSFIRVERQGASDEYVQHGRFTVNQYELDGGGSVAAVSVTFEHLPRYAGADEDGPALYGELRFHAARGFAWHAYRRNAVDLEVPVLDPPATVSLPITSTGSDPLTVYDVVLEVYEEGDYWLSSNAIQIVADGCSRTTLAPGEQCTVTLRVAPSHAGTFSGWLSFLDDTSTPGGSTRLYAEAAWPASAVAWDEGRSLSLPRGAEVSLAKSGAGVRTGHLQIAFTTMTAPAGVYQTRSESGASWTKPVHVSGSGQDAAHGAIAASGPNVYVVWTSPGNWDAETRAVYFRANRRDGTGAWDPVRRLTPVLGKVDVATISAAGDAVYVAYTDVNRGLVRLAISNDRGATWRTATVARLENARVSAEPSVGAAGGRVVVAWADGTPPDRKVRARVSADMGATWGNAATLGGSQVFLQTTTAAAEDRVVVGWDSAVRVWEAGQWGPERRVLPLDGHIDALVVSGSSNIAVAGISGYGEVASWTESRDQGATWAGPSPLVAGEGDVAVSIIWPSPTLRYALVTHSEFVWEGEGRWSAALQTGRGSP